MIPWWACSIAGGVVGFFAFSWGYRSGWNACDKWRDEVEEANYGPFQ